MTPENHNYEDTSTPVDVVGVESRTERLQREFANAGLGARLAVLERAYKRLGPKMTFIERQRAKKAIKRLRREERRS